MRKPLKNTRYICIYPGRMSVFEFYCAKNQQCHSSRCLYVFPALSHTAGAWNPRPFRERGLWHVAVCRRLKFQASKLKHKSIFFFYNYLNDRVTSNIPAIRVRKMWFYAQNCSARLRLVWLTVKNDKTPIKNINTFIECNYFLSL